MKTPTWLSDFEKKLYNGSLTYKPQLKPLAYYELIANKDMPVYQKKIQHYKNNKKVKVTDDVCLDLLDLDKYFAKSTQPYLEMILMQKAYVGKPLVIENSILDKFNIGYHVVYLDGIADFTQHYYDKTVGMIDINDPKYKERYLKNVAGCLIFLNPDNSYFCALPCSNMFGMSDTDDDELTEYKFSDFVTSSNATVKQIKSILKPVPLMRIDDMYAFRMRFTYAPASLYTMDLRNPLDVFNAYFSSIKHGQYYVTYSDNSSDREIVQHRNKLVKYYLSATKEPKAMSTADLEEWNWEREDIYRTLAFDFSNVQDADIASYLERFSHFEMSDTGDVIFRCKFPMPNLTKLMNEHLKLHLHNIRDWSEVHHSNGFVRVGWYHTYQKLAIHELHNLTNHARIDLESANANEIITTSEDVEIDQNNANEPRKPLVQNKGLSTALLSVTGNSQKYYVHNDKLITLANTHLLLGKYDKVLKGIVCDL